MADKMMRMAGRDSSGNAKALSVETDDNGMGVLRIVDSAPYAYDPALDAKRVIVQARHKITKDLQALTTQVASGGAKDYYTLTPPVGKVYKLLHFALSIPAPSGASSGTHQVFLMYGDTDDSEAQILRGTTAFNKALTFRSGYFDTNTDTPYPPDKIMQRDMLRDVYITAEIPLTIKYQNSTDANQTGTRDYYMIFSVEDVTE